MLDQIVCALGRPSGGRGGVARFVRSDGAEVPGFYDNTFGVLTYGRALA